jgi:membrane protease YdiL (CAAX protease family)
MAVAVNNFPFITFFSDRAYIDSSVSHVLLYALSCVCTALFEEMAFRGCVFTSILQIKGRRRSDVFWSIVLSSAIFGLVHVVNLFVGASPISVLLQVGYSFLIGAMCSLILVRTSNIWYCVLLHAVYNFAGGVVPECGGGQLWDAPTVIITTLIALAVASYVVLLLVRTKPQDIRHFLRESSEIQENNNTNGDKNADV